MPLEYRPPMVSKIPPSALMIASRPPCSASSDPTASVVMSSAISRGTTAP